MGLANGAELQCAWRGGAGLVWFLQFAHGIEAEIPPFNLPFIIHFHQDRSHQPNNGVLIGKDTNNIGPSLHFAVEPL